MDWNDSPEQSTFRSDVQAFLVSNLPDRYQRDDDGFPSDASWVEDRKSEDGDASGAAKNWANALGERGWVAPQWPKEYGGAGLTTIEQFIFNMEMTDAGAPSIGGSGVAMLGPTLIVHGTEDQKKEHLPKILNGEII